MRADARRNRERLLAAAEEVFAELGTEASTEEVARRAGVGIGTVFRHFPTKEQLLEAVLVARVAELADRAEQLTAAADPGRAFFALLDAVVAQARSRQTLSEALAAAGVDATAAAAPAKARLRAAAEQLLRAAQQAGAVRPDVGGDELMALMVGIARTAEQTAHDPELQARVSRLLVDGLRPAQRGSGSAPASPR
ncbi:transcriptional regulator, TetR family [Pseudonocardia thermophila]|mgnify:FL=1|uniref:Transcriptional regulator, TetR family n=1 Tax=Pseudonocardia thermophila TaxID=1848 RepID=A0A1M7AFI4_PSETH|nr:TetR/AcrR family transcriptional regulator [Pseudonocardia thermophila]SHL41249.1 transcriptional regulator, TetR family [Pseudonocardia thermophila]